MEQKAQDKKTALSHIVVAAIAAGLLFSTWVSSIVIVIWIVFGT